MTRHGKCVYFTFVGDFRHGTRNYFYALFLLKTLLPELERAEMVLTDHKPDRMEADLFQSFRRRLNELTDSGIVLKTESAKKIFYAKISNPLEFFQRRRAGARNFPIQEQQLRGNLGR